MSSYDREQLDNIRLAKQAAKRHGVPTSMFLAQIGQESTFRSGAKSKAGALGVAQIMPATAAGWGVDPHNPAAALDAAAKNMARYKQQFGSWQNALVAYNAGPGAVGKPLPAETQNYLKVILGHAGGDLANAAAAPTKYLSKSSVKATGPSVTPGTTTVDDDGALVDALLHHHGSLLKRYTANVQSGAYTKQTDPTITNGKVTTSSTQAKQATKAVGDVLKGSKVLELIYNDGGQGFGIKDGKTVSGAAMFAGVWDGHKDHVHVAAGRQTVVALGKHAQSMGLHVGENSHFGGVTQGAHAEHSYHYKDEAIDVSGDAAKMKQFARDVAEYNRSHRLPKR